MITRALFLAAGWFVISLIAALLGGTRLRRNNFLLSVGWLLIVLFLGDLWAFLTFGVPWEIAIITALAFIFGIINIVWLWEWNAFGQIAWTMTVLATLLLIAYAFSITAFSPLNPISFLIALVFFFIETIALLLALSHTYENFAITCRIRWPCRIDQIEPLPGYTPKVSLHVPAYNEPPEVVEATLRSLAKLNYPDYEVLVIDNNTPDEETWRPLEMVCRELGPRFRFLHLDAWPGYKSGALNFALTQTAPDAEIISIVDADYRLDPNFLHETVSVFFDPQVAFLQAPQDFRDYKGHPFFEALYYSYKYFFEVSMPIRNEYNAIIFAGTMGLIRKSVLQQIGGWDEWCITEDAEASLRILKLGYKSIYYKKSFGQGLMPFTFDGVKKQRFRWCFGGIQILKKHWEALMPWGPLVEPANRLSLAQRYFYLVGGLQWFTDVFNLLFAFFLVLGSLMSIFRTGYTVRPLTGPLMVLPAIFLALHLWRFAWVLRHILQLPWLIAMRSMYAFFSVGWVVALACFQGLMQPEGVFLRTPKSQEGESKTSAILRMARWESLIGLFCLGIGLTAFIAQPNMYTLFLSILLAWQSSLYLAAPAFSLLSVTGKFTRPQPDRAEIKGRSIWEQRAARWALALATVLLLVGILVQLLPPPSEPPAYSRYQPPEIPLARLIGLERVPIEERAFTPVPTNTPLPTDIPAVPPSTDAPPQVPPPTNTTAPPTPPATTVTLTPITTGTLAPTGTASLTATVPIPPTPTLTATIPATPTGTASLTATVPIPPTPTPTGVSVTPTQTLLPATPSPVPAPPTFTPVPVTASPIPATPVPTPVPATASPIPATPMPTSVPATTAPTEPPEAPTGSPPEEPVE